MENKFEALDSLEESDEMDWKAWMCEFSKIYMQQPPEQRAYKIIKAFMETDNPDAEAYTSFIAWFVSGYEFEAKERAMAKYFAETY